jgi:hypothetical protein
MPPTILLADILMQWWDEHGSDPFDSVLCLDVAVGDFTALNLSASAQEELNQAAFSFGEFDLNSDGFVDWSEWSSLM